MLDIVTQSLSIATHNRLQYDKQLYTLMQMVHVATVLRYVVINKYYTYSTSVRYIATTGKEIKVMTMILIFQSKRHHTEHLLKQ